MVAIIGLDSGRTILLKIVMSFAPSRYADSTRESGIAWKEVHMTIILKVLMAGGRTMAHMVLII